MNAKLIEGLKLVQEGISLMFESQTETVAIAKEAPPSKVEPVVEVTGETTFEPVVEVENVPEENVPEENVPEEVKTAREVTRESLDEMTYNNLKAFAKELGLKAVGKRADITDRVLEYYANDGAVEESENEEEISQPEVTSISAVPAPIAPVTITKAEETEKPKDKIYRAVMEITEDMENVDIADTLADIGLSVKGKREALIDRVVQAVRDGLLEVEIDDDDDEPVVGEALEAPEVLEANEANEANEAPEADELAELEVTDARRKAITEVGEYLDEAFKKGEVSREDLINFITEFFETDETFDDAPDTDLLEMYLQAHSHFIDDDGETHEGGEAYLLGENPACCGRFLEFIEDTGVYVCETCGNEYEAG